MQTDPQTQASTSPTPMDPAQDGTLSTTAPGQIRVIKRNGKVVAYTDDKITVAITKAFLAVEGGTAAAIRSLADAVSA